MADIQDIFNQYVARAEQLLQEGKLKDAYDLCTKVLETDPEYAPALQLKEKLANSVQGVNQRAIDEKIKALKPLWEQGEYARIIKELTELYRYAPHYEPLESALAQAQDMYRKTAATEEKTTRDTYRQQLDTLLAAKDYQPMIELMQSRNREALTDLDLKNLNDLYRDKIVEQKIAEKSALFATEKYDDIVNFLYQLQQIDRHSQRIENLLHKYRSNLLVSQVSDKQEFVLRATANVTTLYQIGKYEKALQGAEEILEFEPTNAFAKDMAGRARNKYATQLQEESESKITANYAADTAQFKSNPAGFISI